MNKQGIINLCLIGVVLVLAISAAFISRYANEIGSNYIDPDSNQEVSINSKVQDRYSQNTRIILSADQNIFNENRLSPNEYEISITALTIYNKEQLGGRHKRAGINSNSLKTNGSVVEFDVRLGEPESNDRVKLTLNRTAENRIRR